MTTAPASIDRRVLAASILPVIVGVLPAFMVGALAVQIREDLGFSEFGLGLLNGGFFAGGALSSAVLGRTSERVGAVRAMRVASLCSAAILLAIATLGHWYGVLLSLLVLAGVVNALVQTATNLYLARSMPPTRMGIAFGVKQSAMPAAGLLGGLAVPAFALTVGWRWAFAAGAAIAVAAALRLPDVQPAAPPAASGDPEILSSDAPRRITIAFAVGVAFAAAAAGVLSTFLVSGAVDIGIGASTAGLLAAGGSAVSISTRLLLGVRADVRGGGHLRIVAWMLTFGLGGFVLLSVGGIAAFVIGTPLAFALSWAWPGLFNLAMVRHHPNAPAAATGITQTGVYVGAVTGPLIFGLVAEGGYGGAWLMAGIWSVIAGGLIGGARVLLVRHRRR